MIKLSMFAERTLLSTSFFLTLNNMSRVTCVSLFSAIPDAEAVAAAKTLKERQELIKRGLATPFAFQSTKQKDQTSKTLKLDDTFGSFLQTSDESSSSKSQKTAEERKRLSPTIEKQPPAKLIKTSTETDSDYKPSLSSCSSEYEVEGNKMYVKLVYFVLL